MLFYFFITKASAAGFWQQMTHADTDQAEGVFALRRYALQQSMCCLKQRGAVGKDGRIRQRTRDNAEIGGF